jgi:hypothetical protein
MFEMDHGRKQPAAISAWSLIEPYCDSVSIYDGPEVFLEGFSKLPLPSQHLFAVHWCNSEICNGGFYQFFDNSTGILAPEALEGFRAIGADACAELLNRAMNMFGQPYPRERDAREDCLAILCQSGKNHDVCDPFDVLNKPYYAAKDRVELAKLMDKYAQQHAPR